MSEVSSRPVKRRVIWTAFWAVFVVCGLLAARFHLNHAVTVWITWVFSHQG